MAEAWFAEARVLKQLKQKDAALEAVNKFIELRPSDKTGPQLRQEIEQS